MYQNLKSNGVKNKEFVDPLTLEQLKLITDYLHEKKSLRDWCWVKLNVYMGLRASDLFNLKWDDFFYSNWSFKTQFKLIEQKSGKVRIIGITEQMKDILSEYLQNYISINHRYPDYYNYMFLSRKKNRQGKYEGIGYKQGWYILNQVAKAVNIDQEQTNCGTHSLRKTFCCILFENGTSIDVIQMLCNHANKKDTYRYIGKTKEIKLKAQMSVKLDF